VVSGEARNNNERQSQRAVILGDVPPRSGRRAEVEPTIDFRVPGEERRVFGQI
jgi:hypothetical protein